MSSSKYRVFLTAVDMGSFTKAANMLNYTTSGVYQLVNSLEKEVGFSLLYRDNKGVHPTESAEEIIPILREIIAQEERLNQMVGEIKGISRGKITVATYSSIASNWLPKVINDFQSQYPNIEIELMEGIRQEVDAWLREKKADLGFMSYKEPMEYDWTPLAEDRMVAVLPREHELADADTYPLERCQNERFIMPALGRDNDVEELLRKRRLTPLIKFTTLENYSAISMIEQNLGMSIMNELITKNWDCDIVKLPLDPPQCIMLGMAVISREKASPAVKKFMDFSQKHLSKLVDKDRK